MLEINAYQNRYPSTLDHKGAKRSELREPQVILLRTFAESPAYGSTCKTNLTGRLK